VKLLVCGGAIAGCALRTMAAPCFGCFAPLNWNRRMECPACEIHILHPVQHVHYNFGALHWIPEAKNGATSYYSVGDIKAPPVADQVICTTRTNSNCRHHHTIARDKGCRSAHPYNAQWVVTVSSRYANLKSSLVTGRNRRRYGYTVTP
jgi:hypothetical protein